MDLLKNEGRLIVKELVLRVASKTLDCLPDGEEATERKKLLLLWPNRILPAPDDYLSALREEYEKSGIHPYAAYYPPHEIAELAEKDPTTMDPLLLRELLVCPMLLDDVVEYLRSCLKNPGSLREEYRKLLVSAAYM